MLQSFEKRPEYIAALDRVKAWTRERFKLPADTTIFVAEVSCALPGSDLLASRLRTRLPEDAERGLQFADCGANLIELSLKHQPYSLGQLFSQRHHVLGDDLFVIFATPFNDSGVALAH